MMKTIATTVLSLCVGLSAPSIAAPPLEDIVKWLEQTDARIGVLKTEGYTRRYVWDDETLSWKCTPATCSFSLTIENKPNGRYVLYENPSITHWIRGLAPYLAEWTTEFRDADGFITHWKRAYQYHDGTNFSGRLNDSDEVVQSNKSEYFRNKAQQSERLYSGLGYTGLVALRKTPIYWPALASGFTVSNTADGLVRVRFSSSQACVMYDFVFDPRKNFALVRYKYSQDRGVTTADEEFSETYDVLEHRQVADGIWYPVHVAITTKHAPEYVAWLRAQDRERGHTHESEQYIPHKLELFLTDVALLDGRDAEANLTIKLPGGLTVRNEDEH